MCEPLHTPAIFRVDAATGTGLDPSCDARPRIPGKECIAPSRAAWVGISIRCGGRRPRQLISMTILPWRQRSLGAFGAVNAVSLHVERGRITFDACISMPRRVWHVL